jgi:hypothetical protein
MKKWMPFIILIVAIFILVNYLLFTGQDDTYVPKTSDPSIVYQEACAECHGEKGTGKGFLYPDLVHEYLEEEAIIHIVRNGDFFMPSFPHIPDSTLKKLSSYVAQKEFRVE